MTNAVTLDGNNLTIEELVDVCRRGRPVSITREARNRISATRKTLDKLLEKGGVFYGINTGFGALGNKRIDSADLTQLQVNLIRSHAAGVQENLPTEVVRGMMLLRVNTFAKGYSGVSMPVVDLLISMLNHRIHPVVPSKGSVGASGDLAPLAHLALPLIGEGSVEYRGKVKTAEAALREIGLTPVTLRPKDGLALINGTQLMTAIGALAVHDLRKLIHIAETVSAFVVQVLRGSADAFEAELHEVRPQVGQVKSARRLRGLLTGSKLLSRPADRAEAGRYPQDPYSLRCVPQILGPIREAVTYASGVIELEMNSANDNPLVFAKDMRVISGGNFHGQPIAMVLDFLGIAVCSLTNLAERQVYRLLDARLSNGLPPFLASPSDKPGLFSGLMAAQYTMAALASENKVLAHPASVDTIPTSADFEDFVSMGPIAGLKLRSIAENCRSALAIALICVCRAADFRGFENLSKPCQKVYKKVRNIVDADVERPIQADVAKLEKMIETSDLLVAED